LRRDLLLAEIETLIRQVRRIEHQLNQQAQQTPAVAQLPSIPGVGVRTAEAVAALVDDPHRCRHAKAVDRYFGLVPCQDHSGDRNRSGTSRAKARRSSANWPPRRPGRRNAGRRPSARTSSGPSAAI
jgi:transposase